MADIIEIGKLVIDTTDLQSSMLASKKAIIDLENTQKALKSNTENLTDATDEQLQAFVENERQLKILKAEYNANQKSVAALEVANLGLTDSLRKNVRTQDEAIENTKQLIAARRLIDTTTEEGAKAIAEINEKIGKNNELLDASNSKLEQQKTNIGNYGDEFKSAAGDLNIFNGGLSGFSQRAAEAGGAGNLVQNSLGGMAKGFVGVTKASLAFIATPVGAVITALVVVFGLIKNAMNRSEKATASITKIFSVFSGIINKLLDAIVPLGEYFINSYVETLEKVGAATEKAMKLISDSLRFLGFDEAAKSVDNFTASTKASIKEAQALADAERELETAQRQARLTQLEYQKQAEKLRQIRDDESKSLAERVKANKDLAAVLDKQLNDELRIAKVALTVAELRIKQSGRTKEALDEQAAALTQIADIEERITGQRSEQLANENSLRKEAADKQKERASKAFAEEVKRQQNRIELLKMEADQSNLTADQLMQNAKRVFDLQNELDNKTSSGSDLAVKQLKAKQELSSALLAISKTQIENETALQKESIEKNIANNQFELDNQLIAAEDLARAQKLLLDKSLLTEKEYADQVKEIDAEKNIAIQTASDQFRTRQKEIRQQELEDLRALEAVEFELKLQDIIDRDATEQEIKAELDAENYAREKQELSDSLDDKAITYEEYLKRLELADKKYTSANIANEKILSKQKKAEQERTVTNGLNALGAMFEGSKAIAVASALFNTYQGITSELATKAVTPYEIGLKVANVAFVAAAGFAAVKNILKTNKNSSGAGESSPIVTGGSGNFVNTAQTETVATASTAPSNDKIAVTPPVLILETLAEKQNQLEVKMNSD